MTTMNLERDVQEGRQGARAGERPILLPSMDPERVRREIGDFVIDSVVRTGATGAVIGLSGGIDSTTTATPIKRAFDDYNAAVVPERRLELVGYILPTSVNDPADADDGIAVAERLGIRYEVHGIETLVEAYRTTNPEAFAAGAHAGNLRSRVRATVLNTKGATEGKIVAGTGNKDEDFGVGYYTLFGDGAVHMSPIGGLSKRLVREMASHLGWQRDFVHREPTAGLERGQTDFGDLGYGYDLVETVTEGLSQGFSAGELILHSQVQAIAERDRTLYAQRFGAPKFTGAGAMVQDVLYRHEHAALRKAEVVHPPTPRITLTYREAA